MNNGLRITGLITWIFTAIVILFGSYVPLTFGLTLGFGDLIMYLFGGMDGGNTDPEFTGGGWLLGLTAAIVISTILVFAFAIVIFILSRKPHFRLCTSLIIANCGIFLINAAFQFLSSFWVNHLEDSVFHFAPVKEYYLFPITECAVLIVMMVLSVFTIRSLKKNSSL